MKTLWSSVLYAIVSLAFPSMPRAADPPSADAARGHELFVSHRCYACHGSQGQTGLRRIVPMNLPQQGFVTFVQHSTLPAMPSFPDISAADLGDIYAYLRSVPVDAPPLSELPLLQAIQKQSAADPHSGSKPTKAR